jgi:hypothetical protein
VSRVGHIFRWDLDKTYLKTEFDTLRDLVRTARLTAEQRENVPGSAALIKALRDAAVRRGDDIKNLIFFISGSPEQLRTVLEKKFALDGFVPDGFVLKPTVSNILRGRFRAVRNQVGYKLHELIQGRSEAPIGSRETLFGDDAESDAFVYSLYADLVAGRVPSADLKKVLKAAGAYSGQIDEIEAGLEAVVREDPVDRIVIHLDQHTPPVAFSAFFPRVVPIYNHLQTALVLYLDDTVGPECVRRVSEELIARYGYDVGRLANLAEDILRRQRLQHPPERLTVLAKDLRELPLGSSPSSPAEATVQTTADELMKAIADRADYLLSKSFPEEPPFPTGPRDYVALWEAEQDRREEQRRAKKLAGKISREPEREAIRREATPLPRPPPTRV